MEQPLPTVKEEKAEYALACRIASYLKARAAKAAAHALKNGATDGGEEASDARWEAARDSLMDLVDALEV